MEHKNIIFDLEYSSLSLWDQVKNMGLDGEMSGTQKDGILNCNDCKHWINNLRMNQIITDNELEKARKRLNQKLKEVINGK